MLTATKQRNLDDKFIAIAREYSKLSSDISTKVGAIIANQCQIISAGYNQFPLGLSFSEINHARDRAVRLAITLHAEQIALLHAAGKITHDCTLYTYPIPPCSQCAAMAIHSGIKRVVSAIDNTEALTRWQNNIALSERLFYLSGVDFHIIDMPK
jgi:dCMP deaminase